jgi:hypothetical protein
MERDTQTSRYAAGTGRDLGTSIFWRIGPRLLREDRYTSRIVRRRRPGIKAARTGDSMDDLLCPAVLRTAEAIGLGSKPRCDLRPPQQAWQKWYGIGRCRSRDGHVTLARFVVWRREGAVRIAAVAEGHTPGQQRIQSRRLQASWISLRLCSFLSLLARYCLPASVRANLVDSLSADAARPSVSADHRDLSRQATSPEFSAVIAGRLIWLDHPDYGLVAGPFFDV